MTPSVAGALVAGRFEIGARAGQGGMGTVFRGVDTRTGDAVAIKLMNPDGVLYDPGSLERFGREGEALRRLNHPSIVKVLATARDGERHYLVMEWVGGGSLDDVLKSTEVPLAVERVLEIALDLSDALTRSHRLGIIHRDLKPANVLLSDDGTPRLTDFGVAHVIGEKSVTLPTAIVGTLDYMSPEVLRGEPVDVRTDVWGFGVLLFEMLTRRRPFSEGHFARTIHAIANKTVPDLEALRPDCPARVVDLIYRMLEKHREQRIPSVRQVGAELEDVLLGRAGSLRRVSSDTTLRVPPSDSSAERLARALTQPDRAWHSAEREPFASRPLPAEITPFIGRRLELLKLAWLLADPGVRMVTILAPGGMGKTRFALEATRLILGGIGDFGQTLRTTPRFADGVFFVALAPLGAPALVVAAIAEAIGLELHRGREPAEQLLEHVRDREILLVLDNFEHVLEAAVVVGNILRAAPQSVALVTSRERLGLTGETVFELGSMDVPGPDALADVRHSSAVELFVACARRTNVDFELSSETAEATARICRLVGGMPLGIVLAASWVGVMPLSEIASEIERSFDFLTTEMRDVPERQRSLRAAFDHSWKLLDAPEQKTFAGLCVFRGGFSRMAAEAVTGTSIRTLVALTHKSLLGRDPETGRYEIHEMLRQYAAERLAESAEGYERTLDLHAAYYAAFLGEREERLNEPSPLTALGEIDAELDNVRAAWNHMLAKKQLEHIARALAGWEPYFNQRATFAEAEALFRAAAATLDAPRDTLTAEHARLLGETLRLQATYTCSSGRFGQSLEIGKRALALLDENAHPRERAEALIILGIASGQNGDLVTGVSYLESALALSRRVNYWTGTAWALVFLGNIEANAGNFGKAEVPIRECIAIHEQAGTVSVQLLRALLIWGRVLSGQGNYVEARRVFSEGLRMSEEFDDSWAKMTAELDLPSLLLRVGDYAEAETWARRGLRLSQERGALDEESWCWQHLGDIASEQGAYDSAAAYYERARTISQRLDDRQALATLRIRDGDLAFSRGEWALAEKHFLSGLAWFEEHQILWGIACGLDGLGSLACRQGELGVARERFGRSLSIALACKAGSHANRVAAGVALLFSKSGEALRAVELLARARNDSATEHRTRTRRVDPLLAELEKGLPPEEFAAALERGKALDLEALRDELAGSTNHETTASL